MSGINAFVGHSFTENDEAVVSSFLTFFSQLTGLLGNFEWVHAKPAEPKELTQKVLENIDGCNTLIAICTRKEMIVPEDALAPTMFDSRRAKVEKSKLEWKTSDWIIQEIGLAVGRQMSVIILLENGCRRPGGLQGNVEFIPFDRASPEKAHGQLLEMLKALQPAATAAPPKARAESNTEDCKSSQPETGDEDLPDASWDKQKYEDAYFWAFLRKEEERAQEISDALLASTHIGCEESRAEWLSKIESWKFAFGKGGSASTIKKFADDFPQNPNIRSALASALGQLGQHDEAAELYSEAADLSEEPATARNHMSSAAYQLMLGGEEARAFEMFSLAKALAVVGDEASIAYSAKSLADAADDRHLEIEAMEAIARERPDNYDNRFSLAYAHSKMGSPELALHHYLLIPEKERTPVAWNNLGVAYQNLSVSGRAINAYKRSASEGETLAMSNLAYRLMNSGFLDEASEELQRAMKADDPHRNVGEAHAALSDIPESEGEMIKEIVEKAKPKVLFYRELSDSILKDNIESLPPDWTGPLGKISMCLVGTNFEAEWEYENKGNALSGLLASKPSKHQVKLVGTVCGCRVQGKLKRTQVDGPSTLLGELENEQSFAIVFSEDLTSAKVVEGLEKRFPTFYEIVVSDSSPAD